MFVELAVSIISVVVGIAGVAVAIVELRRRREERQASLAPPGEISHRERVSRRGLLIVGCTKHNDGFCNFTVLGDDPSRPVEPRGLYPELARIFARNEGLQIEFRGIKWSELEHAFSRYECDLVVHVLETDRRRQFGSFTFRRYEASTCGIVRADDPHEYVKADLLRHDVRIAVNRGEAAYEYVTEHLGIYSDRRFLTDQSDLSAMLSLVTSGVADIGLCDGVSCQDYVEDHPTTRMIWRDDPVEWRKNSVMIPSGDDDFSKWVNEGFRRAISTPIGQELENHLLERYVGLLRVY